MSDDHCFPEEYRSHYKSFEISIEKCIELRSKLSLAIDKFNGNAEKFFSTSYQVLASGSIGLLGTLNQQETTLLLTEVITFCLCELSELTVDKKTEASLTVEGKQFSKREIDALEYVAGYCFRKIYFKIGNKKDCNMHLNQQKLSILKAVKTDSLQTLVDIKNRGGLWKVNPQALQLLKQAEIIFCRSSGTNIRHINADEIVEITMKDPLVRSNARFLVSSAEMNVDKEIAKNLFEHVIHLYIRVRSHSLAKEIKEKHKANNKSTKKRSLRTEIKKASSSTDMGH